MSADRKLLILLTLLSIFGPLTVERGMGQSPENTCSITYNPDLITGVDWDWSDTSAFYGTELLRVALGAAGVIAIPPGMVLDDGSIRHKMPWFVADELAGTAPRPLEVSARQLDGDGSAVATVAMEAGVPTDFYAVVLSFSNPGCWEITGTAGGESITVTVIVVILPQPAIATPTA